MNTSPEDARLLFERWKDSAAPLRVQWKSALAVFEGKGAVTQAGLETLELGSDTWRFTIPLAGATYVFSDPREISLASAREAETAQYEFGVALLLPSGERLVMVEFRVS